AFAGRREGDVRDAIGDVLPARHHPGKVSARRDVDDLTLARLGVEDVDATALLEHDRAGARIDRLDVEIGEPRGLTELPGFGVERPDVRYAVAIRQEVH